MAEGNAVDFQPSDAPHPLDAIEIAAEGARRFAGFAPRIVRVMSAADAARAVDFLPLRSARHTSLAVASQRSAIASISTMGPFLRSVPLTDGGVDAYFIRASKWQRDRPDIVRQIEATMVEAVEAELDIDLVPLRQMARRPYATTVVRLQGPRNSLPFHWDDVRLDAPLFREAARLGPQLSAVLVLEQSSPASATDVSDAFYVTGRMVLPRPGFVDDLIDLSPTATSIRFVVSPGELMLFSPQYYHRTEPIVAGRRCSVSFHLAPCRDVWCYWI